MRLLVAAAVLASAACQRSGAALPDAGRRLTGARQVVFGGTRPVTVSVPLGYDAGHPTPLLLVLHGYGSSGQHHASYLGLEGLVDSRGLLLVAPDGTQDVEGNRFWNTGSDACCNFRGSAVDDVKYLRELLAEIRAGYNVDPRRIWVLGHSNGGFMAHRLGCELSSEIAAVVSLAGTTSMDGAGCHAAKPVSVLQIHGDLDVGVRYDGGTNILGRGGGAYPGALETVARWAKDDGCRSTRSSGAPIDLESTVPGAETAVSRYEGCPAAVDVALWTIQGGGHVPSMPRFAEHVWGWLEAHRR